MDVPPTRFSLAVSDIGFSAYDSIIEDLDKEIQGGLRESEKNGIFLGHLAAHLHALATLGEGTGGYATTNLDIADLERRTMAAFQKHMTKHPNALPEEIADEIAFLKSLFARLHALAQ
ncbi:hypothetical protein OKA05_21225 [Luteolibacter arcticus]|uniref:Uncharacterized protein n=1 Tax=Luteolibacter arcticus TaxID=1581411 RepID=A0ABT3GNM3_9BACT|nr:hypothetical protein [Luteolibacter arcticus]MCW1925097.1 hypothetical protein [Luteolibacter arcticus]